MGDPTPAGKAPYFAEHDVELHQGLELNPDYCGLIVDRIGQPVFDFGAVS